MSYHTPHHLFHTRSSVSVEKLGKYIPDYASLMVRMTVDKTIQQELRHPRKGKVYTVGEVNAMLSEVGIEERYWERYYRVDSLPV